MQIHWLKINRIVDESPDVKTFYLDQPKDFTWEEGSYTHIALKGFNEGDKPNRSLVRHMSISSLSEENTISFTTRIKDLCSPYKARLKLLEIGDEIALFKTRCNVPLRRENKNIYLLSAGVGIATFRPLALSYLNRQEGINHMTSLNIDSTGNYLFTNIFETDEEKSLTAKYVSNRRDYYGELAQLTKDKDGLYYIVGSDDFLRENIHLLLDHNIQREQIMLDKREDQFEEFFPVSIVK